jgi:hypothetical protein
MLPTSMSTRAVVALLAGEENTDGTKDDRCSKRLYVKRLSIKKPKFGNNHSILPLRLLINIRI